MRKPNIQKKTKENQQNFRENGENNVFEGFRPTLGYVFFVFPNVFFFYKTKKTLEKTKHTKENQRKPTKPSGKPTHTKCLKVSGPPLDMFLFFGFP